MLQDQMNSEPPHVGCYIYQMRSKELTKLSRSAVHFCWLAVLLAPASSLAQRQTERRPPLDPVLAEKEARALVADMLAQKPTQTNTGKLKIRDANRAERELPIRFEVWSTSTTSTGLYQATDPASHRLIQLTVVHADGQRNEYSLADSTSGQTNASSKKLSDNELMVPFAGSDFWVADLGLEFLHWPGQKLKTKEMRRSRFCDVLESTAPRPAPDGYSRVLSWVEQEPPHGIVHAEAYDAKGELIKRFDPTEFEKVQGEYQLQEMEIVNRKTGTRSWIEFDLKPSLPGGH